MTASPKLRTPPPIDSKPKRTVWGRPFQKGVSGNPGGKRKQPVNIGELLRDATAQSYLTLIEIRDSKTASYAVRAYCAEKLIERAEGKAPQTTNLNVSTSQRSIRDLSDAELMSIIEGSRAPDTSVPALAPPTIDAQVEPSVEPVTLPTDDE